MPTISVELAPEIIAGLEYLKADDNAVTVAAGHAPSATVEEQAAHFIRLAHIQACAAGRVPAAIWDDGIPF